MTTKYTVVHYLPRPLSGEKINVGVIAWGGGRIAARFVQDWRRVRSFGREDIEFLQDFVQRVEKTTSKIRELPGLGEDSLDEARLQKIVGNWTRSIQFSEPRSSLKLPEEVLREVAPIYLHDLPQPIPRARDRRAAAALAAQKFVEVLRQRKVRKAEELVQRYYSIRGNLDEHTFDVAVANGRVFFAAQGLSFELSDTASLQKDVDATAWAIDDVKKEHRRLPLAILALPPRRKSEIFNRAKKIFGGLDAKMVVSDEEMGRWAERVSRKLRF